MTITDWPVTYDELEPHYDHFDKLCGVSGKAGNLRGQIIEGGNVFEGPRSDEYPNKPLKSSAGGLLMAEAAKSLGYHPFPIPVSNLERALHQPRRGDARRLPILRLLQPHRLRGECQGVVRRHRDAGAARRSEVRAAHARLRLAARLRQGGARRSPVSSTPTCETARNTSSRPASWCCRPTCSATRICCCSPASASPMTARPARASSARTTAISSKPARSRSSRTRSSTPSWARPVSSMCIDDFNGENFDHGGLGFFGGGYFAGGSGGVAADRRPRDSAWHAALGLGMEAGDSEVVQPFRSIQHPGLGLRQPRQLSRSRSDLPGCARPAADSPDLQRRPTTITRCRAICWRSSRGSSRR